MAEFFKNFGGRSGQGVSFIIGRVVHVVYGPYLSDGKTPDPYYQNPTDIGTIRYSIDNSKQNSSDFGAFNPPAKPAWPSIKYYPVENEYVYLITGPSVNKNKTSGAQDYYYLPPFNLWGSPNHNAFPALDEYAAAKQVEVTTNEEASTGLPNSQGGVGTQYPLGNDFPEKEDIRALRCFVGDLSIEGRWGNSIRLGSSLKSLRAENNWAISNNDGDPIIIIRNGQGTPPTKNPWDPIVEDPNTDKSSIYLTAGQQIVIDDIQNNFSLASFNATLLATRSVTKTIPATPPSNETLSPDSVDNANKSTLA